MIRERPKHRITITLDEDAFKNLSRMATQNDVSIAWVMRYAVDNLLKEEKEGRHQQLVLPFINRTT